METRVIRLSKPGKATHPPEDSITVEIPFAPPLPDVPLPPPPDVPLNPLPEEFFIEQPQDVVDPPEEEPTDPLDWLYGGAGEAGVLDYTPEWYDELVGEMIPRDRRRRSPARSRRLATDR